MSGYNLQLAQMLPPLVLVLFLSFNVVHSQTIINRLPGYPGNLPFKLETGYIGVGELDDVQLFYYFIESERSPKDDPLILWLTGGPGCSAFSGLVYEIGPLTFNYTSSSGNKPQFSLNPYSWTKVANIIFLDQPVGTGFSYARNWEGYIADDIISAKETYTFLRKWLMAHPNFLTNPLYICGDSYSGIVLPIVVEEISHGNDVGREPQMNIKGYVLGNPLTDVNKDLNSRVPFAHLKGLISDKLYESTKRNCKGQYIDVDPANALCIDDLQRVVECIGKLYTANILEPKCSTDISPKPERLNWNPSVLMEDAKSVVLSSPQLPGPWCRSYNYVYSYIWANDKTVQKALHVREGTIEQWVRCNYSLTSAYTENVGSSIHYHQQLVKKGYRILIYSGDHDLVIPYVGTQAWIKSLNLTIAYDWEPWFVDGQVAGYTRQYSFKASSFTFATVKGAGHTAPEYKPKQCFAMIDRWFAYYPL